MKIKFNVEKWRNAVTCYKKSQEGALPDSKQQIVNLIHADDIFSATNEYLVSSAMDFTVYSIFSFMATHKMRLPMVNVVIDTAIGSLVSVPIIVCDIVDPRPSRYWRMRVFEREDMDCAQFEMGVPELFDGELYDQITNYEPSAIAIYKNIKLQLENEFSDEACNGLVESIYD